MIFEETNIPEKVIDVLGIIQKELDKTYLEEVIAKRLPTDNFDFSPEEIKDFLEKAPLHYCVELLGRKRFEPILENSALFKVINAETVGYNPELLENVEVSEIMEYVTEFVQTRMMN